MSNQQQCEQIRAGRTGRFLLTCRRTGSPSATMSNCYLPAIVGSLMRYHWDWDRPNSVYGPFYSLAKCMHGRSLCNDHTSDVLHHTARRSAQSTCYIESKVSEDSCTLDFWDLQFWQALATRWRFRVARVGSCAVLGDLVVCVDISQRALRFVTVFG
jgi:hypothetical protein